jgi:hypothetical protein
MKSLARFIILVFYLVISLNAAAQLDWNCDSIKSKKKEKDLKIALPVTDSAKAKPYVHIGGNNYGNIYINSLDSAEKKAKPDTFCFKNKCFEKPKFQFVGMLFGDFVAIDNDKPNGLIQTNAYLSYTRPVTWCKCQVNHKKKVDYNNKFVRVYPLRNIVITDITLSKIGNQIRYLPVRYMSGDTTKKSFNRFDLLQYSNIIALTKINFLTLEYLKSTKFYFDFIPMFYNTPIHDSLGSFKSNVCTIAFGWNLKVKTEISDHFEAEIAFSVFRPNLFSNIYSDRTALQYKENKGPLLTEKDMLHSGGHTIQVIDLIVGYEPKKDVSKIFFRFVSYQNLFDGKHVPKNLFVQILLGTSIDFDKFIKPNAS